MRQKLAEVSGTLLSVAVVCCVLYFTKSLVQFIFALLAIGVICSIVSWMLPDAEEQEITMKYILVNSKTGEKIEVSKETFETMRELNEDYMKSQKNTSDDEDFSGHWLFSKGD